MKFCKINRVGGEDTVHTIELQQLQTGEWKGTFAYRPLSDTAILDTTSTLTITMRTETSRKGVTRLLMKVEMPYLALYPAEVATGASNQRWSAARSQGKVSAHMVLTLPKECVADIRQMAGGTLGRRAALSQVRFILGVLSTFVPNTGFASGVQLDPESGNPVNLESFPDFDTTGWRTADTDNDLIPLASCLDKALAGLDVTDKISIINETAEEILGE